MDNWDSEMSWLSKISFIQWQHWSSNLSLTCSITSIPCAIQVPPTIVEHPVLETSKMILGPPKAVHWITLNQWWLGDSLSCAPFVAPITQKRKSQFADWTFDTHLTSPFNKNTEAWSTELWASNYVQWEFHGIVVFVLVFILYGNFFLFQVILISDLW